MCSNSGYCSHMIVVHLFLESVKGAVPLIATQCDSYDNFKLGLCANNPKTELGYSVSPLQVFLKFYIN